LLLSGFPQLKARTDYGVFLATTINMFSVHSMQNSTMQSFGNKVRNMGHFGQPSIEIKLNNSSYGVHSSYVVSYSTMDTIEGTVSITVNHDTRFEDVEIAFTGK
jgi:hypothetical protein